MKVQVIVWWMWILCGGKWGELVAMGKVNDLGNLCFFEHFNINKLQFNIEAA